jgi:hypothetical protein
MVWLTYLISHSSRMIGSGNDNIGSGYLINHLKRAGVFVAGRYMAVLGCTLHETENTDLKGKFSIKSKRSVILLAFLPSPDQIL